jgi:hypothetical protein
LISSGKLPFDGKGAATPIRQHVPDLERELAHVLDGCLMRKAALRPQNMEEIQAVLETIEQDVLPEGEEQMEHSGTVPQDKIMLSIERVKREGKVRGPARTKRIALKMDDSEVVVAGLPLSSRTRKGILAAGGGVVGIGLIGAIFLGWGSSPVPPPVPTRSASARPVTRKPKPPTSRPVKPAGPRLAPGELGKLARISKVEPKRFPRLWRRLKVLADGGKLPEGLNPKERVDGLTAIFWKDRVKGCKAMELFLEELRVALKRKSR